MFGKKGEFRHDVLLSLIIGLIVVAIVFWWIFQEFFTEDDIDYEVCRESLILRSKLPEKDVLADVASTKAYLPLKCGTRVVDIDYEDVGKAEAVIGNTISECWYMTGKGEYEIFPGSDSVYGDISVPCMACARIHIDKKVRDFYSLDKNKISIRNALNSQLEGYDFTVWDYLNPKDGVKAFEYFGGWRDEGFDVEFSGSDTLIFGLFNVGSTEFDPKDHEIFYLPSYMDTEKGDLFVMYAEPNKELGDDEGNRISPYMAILQYYDFDKLSSIWSYYTDDEGIRSDILDVITFDTDQGALRVCSSIETIPA